MGSTFGFYLTQVMPVFLSHWMGSYFIILIQIIWKQLIHRKWRRKGKGVTVLRRRGHTAPGDQITGIEQLVFCERKLSLGGQRRVKHCLKVVQGGGYKKIWIPCSKHKKHIYVSSSRLLILCKCEACCCSAFFRSFAVVFNGANIGSLEQFLSVHMCADGIKKWCQ